jgi:iron complex outermembrane receptor protein
LKSIAPPPPPGFTAIVAPFVGSDLPLTPHNKYTIGASYKLPLDDSIGTITLSGTFTHQGTTLGNTTSLPAYQRLPAQDNLNLNLNWNSVAGLPVDFSFFATNVTKEKYYVFTVGNSFGFDSYVANQPRMFGARLKYRFDR